MLNAHRHPSRARDFPRRWRKRIGIAEDTHRFWDLVIKVLGIAALIGSGWWALYRYREDRHAEVNSVIFQKQAEIYFETATVAGTIAYAKDDQELKAAKEKFHELQFGGLAVVEDPRVAVAAQAFHV